MKVWLSICLQRHGAALAGLEHLWCLVDSQWRTIGCTRLHRCHRLQSSGSRPIFSECDGLGFEGKTLHFCRGEPRRNKKCIYCSRRSNGPSQSTLSRWIPRLDSAWLVCCGHSSCHAYYRRKPNTYCYSQQCLTAQDDFCGKLLG